MIDTPQIVDTEAQLTAAIHITIPRDQMPQHFGPAVEELLSVLATQHIEPQGTAYAYHLSMPPGMFDLEIGFIVDATVVATGRVKASQLPATKVARTIYRGPYEGLHGAWTEFDSWMKKEGVSKAPDLWEHYIVGPETTTKPSEYQTELNRPLAD